MKKEKTIFVLLIVVFIGGVLFLNKKITKVQDKKEKEAQEKIQKKMNNPLARKKEIEKKKTKVKKFTKDEMIELYQIQDIHLKKGGRINQEKDYIALLDAILQKEIKPEDAPLEFFYDDSINDAYMRDKGTKKEAKKILEASRDVLIFNYNKIKFYKVGDKFLSIDKRLHRPIWFRITKPDGSIKYKVKYIDEKKQKYYYLKFKLKKEKDIFNLIDGMDEVYVPYFFQNNKKKYDD